MNLKWSTTTLELNWTTSSERKWTGKKNTTEEKSYTTLAEQFHVSNASNCLKHFCLGQAFISCGLKKLVASRKNLKAHFSQKTEAISDFFLKKLKKFHNQFTFLWGYFLLTSFLSLGWKSMAKKLKPSEVRASISLHKIDQKAWSSRKTSHLARGYVQVLLTMRVVKRISIKRSFIFTGDSYLANAVEWIVSQQLCFLFVEVFVYESDAITGIHCLLDHIIGIFYHRPLKFVESVFKYPSFWHC